MMSIWAPNATFTSGRADARREGADQGRSGRRRRRSSRRNQWVSDHPAWKMRVTVNGDRGTLHFECHFIDVKTGKVAAATAADQRRRADQRPVVDHEHGRSDATLSLSVSKARQRARARAARAAALSPDDNPLVRAVGRLPARVHTKLLVAFVGTAPARRRRGVLGLRLLGQSNDRVATLGALQERAAAYGKLRSDAPARSPAAHGERRPRLCKVHRRGAPEPVAARPASTRRSRTPSRGSVLDVRRTCSASCRRRRTSASCAGSAPRAGAVDVMGRDHVATSRSQRAALRSRAEHLASDLDTLAAELANTTTAKTDAVIAQNAICVHELAQPVHRRRRQAPSCSRCCSASSSRGR